MKLTREQLPAQVIKNFHKTWLVNVPFRSERVTFAVILEESRIAKMGAVASDNDQGFIWPECCLDIFAQERKNNKCCTVLCRICVTIVHNKYLFEKYELV